MLNDIWVPNLCRQWLHKFGTTSIVPGTEANVIVQTASAQFVQPLAGQMPKLLELSHLVII